MKIWLICTGHEKNAGYKRIKVPGVTVDPSLDMYKHMNLFPEKLAKANKMLETAKLPNKKHGV